MAIFDRFKKDKKEGFDEGNDLPAQSSDFGPSYPQDNFQPNFSPQTFQPIQQSSDRDFQLVLAKLDIVTHKLEDIDRRLQEIEKIAKESQ